MHMKKLLILILLGAAISSKGNNVINNNYRHALGEPENVELEDSTVRAMIATPGYMSKLLENVKLGSADAQYVLGFCYYNGWEKPQDYIKAALYYEKAAEQGHPKAQTNLGECYEYGNGVLQDYNKALYWYKLAANQNYAEGLWKLGECYIKGIGVTCDEEKAVELFKKSASQGCPQGIGCLGQTYFYGLGIEQSYEKALPLLKSSVEQGCPEFQGLLGCAYLEINDYEKALYWLQIAAEQDDVIAQYTLGKCYENGYGVTKDKKKAIYWYQKAAEQGYEEAIEELNNIKISGTNTIESSKSINDDENNLGIPTLKPSTIRFTMEGNQYRIKCKINGYSTHSILKENSDEITLSQQEASLMMNNGCLKEVDIEGDNHYVDANGNIKDGTIFKLRELRISDICIRFGKAKVISSQSESMILGQGVLNKLGKLEFDIDHKVITLKYHPGF